MGQVLVEKGLVFAP